MRRSRRRLRLRISVFTFILAVSVAFISAAPNISAKARPKWFDPDRHLGLDNVKPGMKGYGLSVFSGTKVERFDFKVLDVIRKWRPKQAVILIEATGQDLKRTGIISGMSGSPVYLKDPADGKDKMIGAVAYGFSYTRPGPAIGGVQPIEQMLEVGGGEPIAKPQTSSGGKPGILTRRLLANMPATTADKPRSEHFQFPSDRYTVAGLIDVDLSRKYAGKNRARGFASGLVPLATPLCVTGLADQLASPVADLLTECNLMMVQGLGAGGSVSSNAKIVPAAAVFVPYVQGDMNWDAVGTVTELIGNHVWVFGHGMGSPSEMRIKMPLSAGVIHTVVATLASSFKLGSAGKPIGTFYVNEGSAVYGRLGKAPAMPAISVIVNSDNTRREYNYKILQDRFYTPLLTLLCTGNSILARSGLPELYTLEYKAVIHFETLGKLELSNTSSDGSILSSLLDVVDPIDIMLNNAFAREKTVKVDVEINVRPESTRVKMLRAHLDKISYRPGEKATINLKLQKYRGKKFDYELAFTVPDDVPDGVYKVRLGGLDTALVQDRKGYPHLYEPTNLQELFSLIKRVSRFQANRIYLAFDKKRPGLGIHKQTLLDLPSSKLAQLRDADTGLVSNITSVERIDYPCPFVLADTTTLRLTVSRETQ